MARINEKLQEAISEFKTEHSETASVTTLIKQFAYWKPMHRPRQHQAPQNKAEAEKAALQRALFNLAQLVDDAASNKRRDGDQVVRENERKPVLNVVRAEFPVRYDVNDVAEAIGANGKRRGIHTHENYVVRLDDDFAEFTQSLSAVYGGPKPLHGTGPTPEYQALKDAVAAAAKTRTKGKDATTEELIEALGNWIDAYSAYASKLPSLKGTLPKADNKTNEC